LAITNKGTAQNAWQHHHKIAQLKTLSLSRQKNLATLTRPFLAPSGRFVHASTITKEANKATIILPATPTMQEI
jgi:hypothetical protein